MNIKEYIKKHGWQIACEPLRLSRSMTVDISFINANGDEDETEFDCRSYDVDELKTLYHDFCKENGLKTNTFTAITIVEMRITKI